MCLASYQHLHHMYTCKDLKSDIVTRTDNLLDTLVHQCQVEGSQAQGEGSQLPREGGSQSPRGEGSQVL